MIVSNNTLLNILTPHENKALQEVLKEADVKTLLQSNKGLQAGDILKNLFNTLQKGEQSNETILNLLKNSTLSKELGSLPNNLQTLISSLPNESKFGNIKAILQNFLLNIENVSESSLKEQIFKSGIFLENKLSQSVNPSVKINELLTQIQQQLQQLKPPGSEGLIQQLSTLMNQSATAQKQQLQTLLPQLTQLASTLQTTQATQPLEQLISKLQNVTNQTAQLEPKLQAAPLQNVALKTELTTSIHEVLKSLQGELKTQNHPLQAQIGQQIEKLLAGSDPFAKQNTLLEPKQLLTQLIQTPALQQQPVLQAPLQALQTIADQLIRNEQLIQNNQPPQALSPKIIESMQQQLTSLQNLLQQNGIELKPINSLIDKLLGIQNLYLKSEVPQNFVNFLNPNLLTTQSQTQPLSSNLNSILTALKAYNLEANPNVATQNSLPQILTQLENIMTQNQAQFAKSDSIFNSDLKALLLQAQSEIAGQNPQNETLKNIDKVLTQIDYYQLLSITSSSNYVYIPFLWDMIEEGSISMKKSKEETFYCEIDLTLKSFGEVNMMLGLYDKDKMDILIHSSSDEFKELVQENLQALRLNLNKIGIMPMSIQVVDKNKEESTQEQNQLDSFGTGSLNLEFGVDIKV